MLVFFVFFVIFKINNNDNIVPLVIYTFISEYNVYIFYFCELYGRRVYNISWTLHDTMSYGKCMNTVRIQIERVKKLYRKYTPYILIYIIYNMTKSSTKSH